LRAALRQSMLPKMKAVDFAVSQILPEDLRQQTYDLSKKGMASLLANVASRYPERFREISKNLGDLGRNAAWYQGYSTTAEDTLPVIDTSPYYKQMDAEMSHLKKQRRNMDPEEFEDQRNDILQRYSNLIEKETMKASKNNAFAQAVVSGARGNPAHVKAILSTPGVYTDAKGRIIPLFVRNSFANGVRPAEMLAGTYGARLSVVSTKKATAKGGDLMKLWQQNVSNYNVTEPDCGTDNGLDLNPQDDSLSGRVLARPLGSIPAGTVIDRAILKEVRKQVKPIIARSAMTCRAKHGICSKCAGVQAGGNFPAIGDSLGVTAASAIGEPIVQGSLNTKHQGGMAKGKKSFSGLDTTIQFVQIPEEFKDKAAVAEVDGVVEAVDEAPQGGTYITVNGQRHFAMPGYASMVKVGEKVEAGDILSDGLANPADIVRLRGLGEGRRYYADRLGQILTDSGNPPDRRHMELVARAVIDDYRVEDPDEDSPWLPDDMVRESEFLDTYQPPKDTADNPVDKAIGSYLQKPVLHFTVGTKVTPKIATRMKTAGVQNILTSKQTPWFSADMKRLRVASHDSKDWLQSLGTSYLSSQMRDSLERGDETNVQENPHYGPRLAFGGDAGKGAFGEKVRETGMF
jgi:DNA-directed RNA polymerase subunit beta'